MDDKAVLEALEEARQAGVEITVEMVEAGGMAVFLALGEFEGGQRLAAVRAYTAMVIARG
jgi:uncharacterized protein GlcG (DUF336 family)